MEANECKSKEFISVYSRAFAVDYRRGDYKGLGVRMFCPPHLLPTLVDLYESSHYRTLFIPATTGNNWRALLRQRLERAR
jgi:hypothetical protein